MAKIDLTGQRFGKLLVIKDSGKRASNGGILWECQCDCGNIATVAGNNLRRKLNPTQSCGCKTNSKDLRGQRFGSLLAIKPTEKRVNQKVVWECLCDCGKIHYATSSNLINGSVKSCGKCKETLNFQPIPKEEQFIGAKINNWTILQATEERRRGYIVYICQCDCGNIERKTLSDIRNIKGQFCNKCRIENLEGQIFTYLTPIIYTGTINRNAMWLCKCQCGNELIVSASNLKSGNTKSCGCLIKSAGESKIEELLTQNNIIFEAQKTFDSCRFNLTNALARFDYYLPAYNILIEYDGIQHFKQRNGREELSKIQERDRYKTQWCKENNIPLIRIPYTDYNKLSIEYLLKLIEEVS